MSDLISRQAAIDAIDSLYFDTVDDHDRAKEKVKRLPSSQPERKKGKWAWSDEDASWKCGSCDCVFEEFEWKPEYNFCPNCGSDMRGELNV